MSATQDYFRNVYMSVKTILIGMRITLKYCFTRTITVQYPEVAPTIQPRMRGFHYYEIEKCIACDMCARACPVDCIYIEKTKPRKIDKTTGVAMGGAIIRYAIDYSKCMFCGLCIDPCPTGCIHMSNVHDMTGYTRADMIVEFTELAERGLRTSLPLWMHKDRLPEWTRRLRQEWIDHGAANREKMLAAMTEQAPPPKPKKEPAEGKASSE